MQTPRFSLALACALLLAAATLGQDQGARPPDGSPQARIGRAAPDFALTDHNGKPHKLSEYKDKVVVLEWVNQQCPWSMKTIPVMKALRTKYAGKGIVWLGVESTHWRKPEENISFAKENGLDFPILMDNDGTVGRTYGAKTTPHVFVIDKGKLAYRGAPHDDQYGRRKKSEVRYFLDEALQAVLAGKPVSLAETKSWGCSVKYNKKPGDAMKPGKKGK